MSCWPAMRKGVNGVIFVFSANDSAGARKLDLFSNFFVSQSGLSPRQCIVFSHLDSEDNDSNKAAAKLCKRI